jgi:hypothetical protein
MYMRLIPNLSRNSDIWLDSSLDFGTQYYSSLPPYWAAVSNQWEALVGSCDC